MKGGEHKPRGEEIKAEDATTRKIFSWKITTLEMCISWWLDSILYNL